MLHPPGNEIQIQLGDSDASPLPNVFSEFLFFSEEKNKSSVIIIQLRIIDKDIS